jgi:lambda family phage tail tape measure protein
MAKAIETLSIKLDFKAGSGSQQIIDKIGSSIKNLKAIAGQTGPSVDKVRRSINDFSKQGNKSISTIEGQVTALRALRREADINSKEFKELTADIGRYEKQLNKAQGRRGGGGARQATQVAGAVISGGIFGGPEGAIGGAIGAFGGVQGAFAGAAIGAQVGGARRAVGEAADYAAQIGKLKIALEGVAPDQNAYTSALETAAEATRELNVPQDAAVRGITRLTAAVTGAGGPIGDAETTFKNVTAAIKATGGSTEDVKGAITAMVQVFSKGKVSAEELSGQLGERLPGAVTMFAKANKMTLPELQKNLKAGTVGLNELMRFVEELGTTFEGTAKKIAGSNEEAGARLSVAIREMQAEVGTALIPIGAQFQDAFGEFIRTITPFLKQALPAIGNLLLGVSKNLDTLAVAAAAAIAALSVIKILAIVTAIKSLSVAKFALLRRVVLLKKGLAALNLVALANPYVLLAAGAAVLATKIHNAAKEQNRLNLLIREGGVAAIDKEIVERETKLFAAEKRLQTKNDGDVLYNIPGAGPFTDSRFQDERRSTTLRNQINELKGAKGRARNDATQGADLDFSSFQPFDYGTPTTESGGGGGGGKTRKGPTDISDLQLQARLAARIAARTDATIEQRKRALMLERESAVLASEELTTNKQIDAVHKAADNFRKGMLKIEKDVTAEQEKQLKATTALNSARMQLQTQLGLTTKQGQVKTAQDSFKQQYPGATDQDLDLIRQTIDPTLFEQGTAQIRAMKDELAELLNPINQVTGAANAIGTAFTDSFRSVIDGSATTQEALAGFFKNIGDYFLDMAMQIIQKMITMYILNTFVGLLPGLGGGGGGGGGNIFSDIAGRGGLRMANGGVFAKNKIVPYAKGGIVDKPTMFAYANGGAGRFGLMGEAGPEAIMPLQRGPGGKLGVQASGGGGVSVGNINITVENTGDQLNPAAQKQLAGQVQGIVLSTLANERRSGGML